MEMYLRNVHAALARVDAMAVRVWIRKHERDTRQSLPKPGRICEGCLCIHVCEGSLENLAPIE
jgi:hypothetical protein